MKREPRVLNRKTDHVGRHAVYVGRPSKWGNPFTEHSRRVNIMKYRIWMLDQTDLAAQARAELAGKDLVCWCAPEACHADTLLRIANSSPRRSTDAGNTVFDRPHSPDRGPVRIDGTDQGRRRGRYRKLP